MILCKIPFNTVMGGIRVKAIRYVMVNETRPGHCKKAIQSHGATLRRREKGLRVRGGF